MIGTAKTLAGGIAVAALTLTMGPAPEGASSATRPASHPEKAAGECVESRSGRGCGIGAAIEREELAISPDGENAYVTIPFFDQQGRGGVWIYERDPTTGSLEQKKGTAGCIAQGRRGGCALGRGLNEVHDVVVSPDGRNVYTSTREAIALFDRDSETGALAQAAGPAGCITSNRGEYPTCAPSGSVGGPMAISPDGRNLYINGPAVEVFDRDPTTGALTRQPGFVGAKTGGGDVIVSPDGRNVYAGSSSSSVVQTFDRDPVTGSLTRIAGRAGCISERGRRGCRRGHEVLGDGFSISPDGRNLYSAQSPGPGQPDYGSLTILNRLPDGTLTQDPSRAGCFAMFGDGEGCARTEALSEASDTTVSADGKRVFVFDSYSGFRTSFFRHPSGRLSEKP